MKTILMQNFGGQIRCITGNVEIANDAYRRASRYFLDRLDLSILFLLFNCSVTTRSSSPVPLWLRKLFSGIIFTFDSMHTKVKI